MSISRASVTKKTDITINVIAYGNLLLQHRHIANVKVTCTLNATNEREETKKNPLVAHFLCF